LYLDHFGFREQPFGVTPDPRFLYFGASHREALASLYYGLESGRGFLALTARPGMGKTTLLFQLLANLPSSTSTAFVFQTNCDPRQLVRSVLADLRLNTLEGDDLFQLQNRLNEMLIRESEAGRRFVLVVDEAQNLDDSVLETLRMLSNFETPGAKLMQIILAGQPQLRTKLASTKMVQLRQRISILTRLTPLNAEETKQYVAHRLAVAGYKGSPLFSPEALEMLASSSGGIPRNINNLCFHALTVGFALGEKRISSSILEEVLADLDLQSQDAAMASEEESTNHSGLSSAPSSPGYSTLPGSQLPQLRMVASGVGRLLRYARTPSSTFDQEPSVVLETVSCRLDMARERCYAIQTNASATRRGIEHEQEL
jgi:general secretion pathway protein A